MKKVSDFIFLGSKIILVGVGRGRVGDCSHEIKRPLLLGRKAITNLDSVLKSRDITLQTKVCVIKTAFSSRHVQMWVLDYKEGWALKNWCFQTMMLEKTLESSLGQQGDQTCESTLNIHLKNWCWSWSSNILDTWCKEPARWKRAWCWERLKTGEGSDRGWDGWMASSTQWTWVWANSGR